MKFGWISYVFLWWCLAGLVWNLWRADLQLTNLLPFVFLSVVASCNFLLEFASAISMSSSFIDMPSNDSMQSPHIEYIKFRGRHLPWWDPGNPSTSFPKHICKHDKCLAWSFDNFWSSFECIGGWVGRLYKHNGNTCSGTPFCIWFL